MSSLNAPYASSDSGATFLTEINADLAELNTDKAEVTGQEFTGKVFFSGSGHAGIQVNSLTTTERNALTPVNGDLIYNETTDKFQMYQGGAWIDVTSVASDASATIKGIVEIATDAEVEAGTGTGGTGAVIVVAADSSHLPDDNEMAALAGTSGTPSGSNKFITADDVKVVATADKIVRADGSNKIDDDYLNISDTNATTLTDGSNASALHIHGQYASLLATRDIAAATASVDYAHGLTGTPDRVKITAYGEQATHSTATFDGTNTDCIYVLRATTNLNQGSSTSDAVYLLVDSTGQTGVVSVDSTNVSISWTKAGSDTGTAQLLIEAWID